MGAQFGRWNFDGGLIPTGYVDRVRSLLSPFGPDGDSVFHQPGLSLVWCSFETTEEHVSTERVSNRPIRLESGEILMWNGRLDNGADVIRSAGLPISAKTSDVEIIAGAWSRWG